jgi:surface antigen
MSSVDDRQNSATTGLQIPGLVSQLSPVEQLPFPEYPSLPDVMPRDPFQKSSPGVTEPLADPKPILFPAVTGRLPEYSLVTRQLPDVDTGALPATKMTTTTLVRQPILIRGTGKKSTGITRPPKGRRWVIHTAVASLCVLIGLLTLMTVLPTGAEGHSWNPFQSVFGLVQSNSGSANFIEQQQAATATAITHQDGYDPTGQNYTGGGVPVVSSDGGGLNRFAYGNCTYWANMRYHQLTGYWVPWLGNAWQWYYGASASGWIVSSSPHVPSIIVLQPYVQGASGYGHVAVVERINSDGSVLTSDYNWAGYWDIETFVTFRPGPGVSFVWHP